MIFKAVLMIRIRWAWEADPVTEKEIIHVNADPYPHYMAHSLTEMQDYWRFITNGLLLIGVLYIHTRI